MKRPIYCLIPARSGSKRIPKKNIKNFCGLPIIAWSIKSAINSNLFDRVIVSTDDIEISEIALNYGAEVPFKRPKNLSDDYSTTLEVINHFISLLDDSIKSCNPIIFCLYATAPFIKNKQIRIGLSKFLESDQNHILFLAKEYNHPIERSFFINEDGYSVLNFPNSGNQRTQDLRPKFYDAGQFYIGAANSWNSQNTIIQDNYPLVISNFISHDIDNKKDWEYAEKLYKSIYQ